jgi:hypothetical protein
MSLFRTAAGDNFREYGITHGGIGVWDKTSDAKFTIEFVSDDYVGALLPDFDEEARSLVWKNGGNVVFTSPSEESDWLNSQLICDATGVAYNQLVSYIEDNAGLFASFQPVEVVHYNGTDSAATGTVLVSKTESFWFVNRLVRQLSSYGADTESFLDIHATSYQYIARSALDPAVVSWSADGAADADVYSWYRALSDCYSRVLNETEDGGGGADYFLGVSGLPQSEGLHCLPSDCRLCNRLVFARTHTDRQGLLRRLRVRVPLRHERVQRDAGQRQQHLQHAEPAALRLRTPGR